MIGGYSGWRIVVAAAPLSHITPLASVTGASVAESPVTSTATDMGMDTGIDRGTDRGTDGGQEGRWLTYGELAQLRRIDRHSAVKLVAPVGKESDAGQSCHRA